MRARTRSLVAASFVAALHAASDEMGSRRQHYLIRASA